MDGALGRNLDVSVEPPHQQFADLARTPVRLLGLEADDKGLDLLRELVGIAHRPSGAVTERLADSLPVAELLSRRCRKLGGACSPTSTTSWPLVVYQDS